MNTEKQNLVNLLSKIDQKQKELTQLRKEFKAAFSADCESWKEQVSSTFPNLQPCGIDEYVGVDVVYKGKAYNIFISEDRQKLYCMFCYDRKDKSTYRLSLKDADTELKYILGHLFDSKSYFTSQGYFRYFKKENYDEAFDFFLKVVKAFASC